jgi:hypothetical protein
VIHIRKKQQSAGSVFLPLLLTLPLWWWIPSAEGGSPDTARYQLQPVHSDMSDYEYRRVYRKNQKRVRKFITHYSEDALHSLGIPRRGIRVAGALAGAAITQDATLYLNDGKSLALDIRDAARNDRVVFLAYKHSW